MGVSKRIDVHECSQICSQMRIVCGCERCEQVFLSFRIKKKMDGYKNKHRDLKRWGFMLTMLTGSDATGAVRTAERNHNNSEVKQERVCEYLCLKQIRREIVRGK